MPYKKKSELTHFEKSVKNGTVNKVINDEWFSDSPENLPMKTDTKQKRFIREISPPAPAKPKRWAKKGGASTGARYKPRRWAKKKPGKWAKKAARA